MSIKIRAGDGITFYVEMPRKAPYPVQTTVSIVHHDAIVVPEYASCNGYARIRCHRESGETGEYSYEFTDIHMIPHLYHVASLFSLFDENRVQIKVACFIDE